MTTKAQLSGQPGTFLYCEECGEESSSNPRDYFYLPDEYVFTCCGEPLPEVRAHRIYEPVTCLAP